ncbi:MAG: sigma-70 family RNA polymerase sigma factor [Anaerovoracaceae bacterium]|jgi:RNA polymerase sigma-70 factor (ECF subfamily)|nr:sigma-70 family RNA polymerase sigma factor [Anaerovoracaceae bacterium]
MANNLEEARIIKRAKNGSESDFETLILSCQGKAYSIAYRYLNNQEDAMDALQESFIKAYRSLATFKGNSSFQTWIYRIVVNTCYDMLRKKKSRIQAESLYKSDGDEEYMIELPDQDKGPEELALDREESRDIFRVLEMLPLDQKEIILLRDVEGYSYEEIVDILSITMGTVKSRISRARLRLRELYLESLEQ